MDTIGGFRRYYYMGAALTALLSFGFSAPAAIAQEQAISFDIPAQPLSGALNAYARTTGRQILFSESVVRGLRNESLQGRYEPQAALDRLLGGSGLTWRRSAGGALLIERAAPSPQVAAAAANALTDVSSVDELVVTGTRISGIAPVGSRPVALEREAIASAGRTTAADLLRTLPQVTALGVGEEGRRGTQSGPVNTSFATGVNLRGFGTDATLTLLHGHRVASSNEGGVVDVGQVPLIGIERVEVLADGASAIYGSDAVAGVVNFVFREGFEGAETSLRVVDGDGFNQVVAGQAAGARWSGGSAFAAFEYFDQSRLRAKARSYYTDDLRAYGGPNLRSNNGVPGTILAGGVPYAIPAGQNGIGLTPAQLLAGTANQRNRWADADILPDTEKFSGLFTVRQSLTPKLEFFADGIVARRRSVRADFATETTLTVPRTNPFFVSPVAGASTVSVLYNFAGDLGANLHEVLSDDVTVHGGAELTLAAGWSASLTGLLSRNRTDEEVHNAVNLARVAEALADPNPQTAFNPFGDAGSNSAAVLERIRGSFANKRRMSLSTIALDASGPILELPGGPLRLALGAETRKDRFHAYSPSDTTAVPRVLGLARLSRRVDAIYAELFAPLVGPSNSVPVIESLTLSAAVRGERYSDFGETWNPKLGVDWRPAESLKLSGTWGTSFKAPMLRQTEALQSISVQTLGLQSGPAPVISISGNRPDLGPEEAETWTASATYTPAWAPGLQLDVTYFDVSYEGRILRPSASEFIAAIASGCNSPIVIRCRPSEAEVQEYYNSPLFTGTSRPAPSSIAAIVDNRTSNLGRLEQSGLDVHARYSRGLFGGTASADLLYTRVLTYKLRRLDDQPFLDQLNTIGNPVDDRARVAFTWQRNGWQLGAAYSYVGGYTNTTLTPNQKVSDWGTVDTRVSYSFGSGRLEGATISLDVRNTFDADPPKLAHVTAAYGYDPEQASAIGRTVAVTLQKTW